MKGLLIFGLIAICYGTPVPANRVHSAVKPASVTSNKFPQLVPTYTPGQTKPTPDVKILFNEKDQIQQVQNAPKPTTIIMKPVPQQKDHEANDYTLL